MRFDGGGFDRYYAHEPSMKRVAWRILRDEELARDVVQEAFIVALTHTERVDNPKHWLVRVTRNLALLAIRRASRRRRHEENADAREAGRPVDAQLAQFETRGRVFRAMRTLDPLDKSLLFFRFAEQENYLDIAIRFDMTTEQARSRVRRALARLRGVTERPPEIDESWFPDCLPGFESPDPRAFAR